MVLYIIPNLHVVFIIPQNFHDMPKTPEAARFWCFFYAGSGAMRKIRK